MTAARTGGAVLRGSWLAPSTGGPPSDYIVEAGSVSGANNLAVITVDGPVLIATAPAGVYYFRVRARNAAGVRAFFIIV